MVDGDRVLGLEMQDDVLYAARIAMAYEHHRGWNGSHAAANGTLGIASTSDLVVALQSEIYNNNSGSTQLFASGRRFAELPVAAS